MIHINDARDLQRDFLDAGRIFRCPWHDCSARLTLANRTAVQPCTATSIEISVPANITGAEHSYAYVGRPWVYIINAEREASDYV